MTNNWDRLQEFERRFGSRANPQFVWYISNCCFVGCCHGKPLLVPGGRVFVLPGLQKIQRFAIFVRAQLNLFNLVVSSCHLLLS